MREGGFAAAQMPIVLGAEGAGEVAETGPGRQRVRARRPSCHQPLRGECPACAAGGETECPNLRVVGEHLGGTYAEYIALPAPDGLGYPESAASIVVGRVRAAARASRGGERRGSLRPRSATR